MRPGLIWLGWLFWASAAPAGPWPREDGRAFLSVAVEAPEDGDSRDLYYTLYGEYGATPWLTFGLDAGSDYYTNAEGYAFGRVPLFGSALAEGSHRLAALAGLGARQVAGQRPEALYVLGASWGMGFDGWLGPGWATLDGSARWRADSGTRLLKLDATLGLNRQSGQLWFAQLRYADDTLAPDPTLELAPSIAWPLWQGTKLETAAALDMDGGGVKFKLGLWSEF